MALRAHCCMRDPPPKQKPPIAVGLLPCNSTLRNYIDATLGFESTFACSGIRETLPSNETVPAVSTPGPCNQYRPMLARVGQIPEHVGIIDGGVAVGDLDMPPAFQRREHYEQIGDAIAFVFVIVARWLSRFGGDRRARLDAEGRRSSASPRGKEAQATDRHPLRSGDRRRHRRYAIFVRHLGRSRRRGQSFRAAQLRPCRGSTAKSGEPPQVGHLGQCQQSRQCAGNARS